MVKLPVLYSVWFATKVCGAAELARTGRTSVIADRISLIRGANVSSAVVPEEGPLNSSCSSSCEPSYPPWLRAVTIDSAVAAQASDGTHSSTDPAPSRAVRGRSAGHAMHALELSAWGRMP
jgi:hypothetical protein